MTRLNSVVILLVAVALMIAVPSAVAFGQANPKVTGSQGGGGERSSPPPPPPPPPSPPPSVSRGDGGGSGGGFAPKSGGGERYSPPPPPSRSDPGYSGGAFAPRGEPNNINSGGSRYKPGAAGESPTYNLPRGGGASTPNESRLGSRPMNENAPWFSRQRGNNPVTGRATGRPTPVPGVPYNGNYSYGPYYGYYPGYYYGSGYYGNYGWGMLPFGLGGFGAGYSYFYDPYWSGYGGYSGYDYGSEYGGYGWGTPVGYGPQQPLTGSLRLKVKPPNATVYVDGYYAGRVDDFDGVFQKLKLEPGPHRIEISADGFKTASFEVNIRTGETVNFQGELEIIR